MAGNACDIYCPDCGQGFSQNEDQENEDRGQFQDAHKDTVFKKPTVLTKVLKCIWNPFKPAESVHSRCCMSRPGSSYPHCHNPYPPRNAEIHSDVASQTGTWLGSIFNYGRWNRKRQMATDVQSSRPERLFGDHLFLHNQSLSYDHYDGDSKYTAGEIEVEDFNSEDTDSDRLNLREYVQPKKRKFEEVESWVNNLKDDMDAINSLLTVDLSCDCKSGVAKSRNDLITKFLAESGDQILKLQELLNAQESYKDQEVKLIRSLAKSCEQTKVAILDCSKSQQLIIYKHITELAKLDREMEEEVRNLTQQQTRQIEKLQSEILVEEAKIDSESILKYYSEY